MPGAELARDRLAALRRLAGLLAAQEDALEAGDLEGAQTISDAALALQEEIGVAVEALARCGPGSSSGADEATELLRAALAGGERVRVRIEALRQEVMEDLHQNARGRREGASYLRATAPERRESLDLRL